MSGIATECASRGLGCVVIVGEFHTNKQVTKFGAGTAESDDRYFFKDVSQVFRGLLNGLFLAENECQVELGYRQGFGHLYLWWLVFSLLCLISRYLFCSGDLFFNPGVVNRTFGNQTQSNSNRSIRWLDTVFRGHYLPSLSINCVSMNKDLEKLPPLLYQIKMKICCDQVWKDIGVVVATK